MRHGGHQICRTWSSWSSSCADSARHRPSVTSSVCGAFPQSPTVCLQGGVAAREHNPGPEVQTDEELVAWVRQYTNSIARTPLSHSPLSFHQFFRPADLPPPPHPRHVGDMLDAPARQRRGCRPTTKGQQCLRTQMINNNKKMSPPRHY